MSSEQPSTANGAEQLSALVDGDLGSEDVVRACSAWRSDSRLRQTWHAYHLIGDVLRSEDLASVPGRDADFLSRLRDRLADEPVVLAPQPLPSTSVPVPAARWARHWRTGAAVAAGFVVVAGALVAMRTPSPEPGVELARAQPAVPAVTTGGATTVEPGIEQASFVTDGRVIRDARLDRYLAAHQQFAGTSALGVPSAFLRSATTDASKR